MDLDCELLLLAAIVRRAILDARQSANEKLRNDALNFLWAVAPDIAKRAGVPQTITAENVSS